MNIPKGLDIDIVTGRPKGLLAQERKAQEKIKALKEVEEAQAVVQELRTKPGERLLASCREVLSNRINQFVNSDPECRAITEILRNLGEKIKWGQVKADELMKSEIPIEK